MPDRGTKRRCANCGASYYDLNRQPVICPKCGAAYDMTAPVRPVRSRAAAPPPPPPPPRDELELEEAAENADLEPAEDEFEEAEDLPSDEETFVSPDDEDERD